MWKLVTLLVAVLPQRVRVDRCAGWLYIIAPYKPSRGTEVAGQIGQYNLTARPYQTDYG